MIESDFKLESYNPNIENGAVSWSSPSNIALVKYWGKKENQIPANPSLSFTLDSCKTVTKLTYSKKENTDGFSFEVFLDSEKKEEFKPKIKTFFSRIAEYVPFVRDFHFTIVTSNTFPHSSGIASSASGMSALALCLMSLERRLNSEITDTYFNQKASFLARLGSGSASRSVEGPIVTWGKHDAIENSSDLVGLKYQYEVHKNFNNYQDTILLVDEGEKQVSSTVGHKLMHDHPFAVKRFEQAHQNINKLKRILASGDLKAFVNIVESEALTLHAMMLTSIPCFILMKPNTLKIINKIWEYRQQNDSNVCFTLDAGANVHMLYPDNETNAIVEFVKNELVAYCQNGHYICDRIGVGAKQQPI